MSKDLKTPKKKYVPWANGFIDHNGQKRIHHYLEEGFPFDCDKKPRVPSFKEKETK